MKNKECIYYPCHFEGQDCTFCYCPLYPCKDESRGDWFQNKWDCTKCHKIHNPKLAYIGQMYINYLMGTKFRK